MTETRIDNASFPFSVTRTLPPVAGGMLFSEHAFTSALEAIGLTDCAIDFNSRVQGGKGAHTITVGWSDPAVTAQQVGDALDIRLHDTGLAKAGKWTSREAAAQSVPATAAFR